MMLWVAACYTAPRGTQICRIMAWCFRDLHIPFKSFQRIEKRGGCILMQSGDCHGNVGKRNSKILQKEMVVEQPARDQWEGKQKRNQVFATYLHMCVLETDDWGKKWGVSSRTHKVIKACDDRVWGNTQSHSRWDKCPHTDTHTNAPSVKSVTADGAT